MLEKQLVAAAVFAISARAYADDNGTGSNAPTSPPISASRAQPSIAPIADPDRSPTAEQSEQIEVHGTAPVEPSGTFISAEEARQLPGALGDPLRGISTLSGFVPIRSNLPYYYLRGAPPNNVEYLIDGVRVPLLFHDGVISSVIAPGLVGTIEIYPSAVPAQFGGSAGGVVALDTRPLATSLRGEAAVKWYEASALVETPFAGDGTALAAARIGYPGLVTQLSDPNNHLSYWDYQTRETWKLDDHNRLGVFAFGSHDRSTSDDNGRPVETLRADFHRIDLRYDHFGDRGYVRLGVTAGWSSLGAAGNQVEDWTYAARLEGQLRLSSSTTLRATARLDGDRYSVWGSSVDDPASGSPTDAIPDAPKNLIGFAGVDLVWRISDDLQLVPGVRAGYFRSQRASASGTVPVAEPTFGMRYRLAQGITSLTSFGVAHQLPSLRVGDAPSYAVSVAGFPTGDARLQRSVQAAQSVELVFPSVLTATATAFASWTRAESDLPEHCGVVLIGFVCPDERPDAHSFGLELSAKRSLTERLAGLLSYTFSKTTEQFRDGTTQRSPYDRRHVLNVVAAYELGRHWRAGARGAFYTGEPVLDVRDAHPVMTGGQQPVFYRADLRFDRHWGLAHGRSITLVLEILNATFTQDPTVPCVPPPGNMCTPLPGSRFVVPSVGVEGAF